MGFSVCRAFADALNIPLKQKKHSAIFGKGNLSGSGLLIALPQTYMNESVRTVSSVMAYYKVKPSDVLVICDDVNLSFGRLRFRKKGSDGGHKGLRSIIEVIGPGFNRLRIGVGQSGQRNLSGYVLSSFRKTEKEMLPRMIQRCVKSLYAYIEQGIEAAMCSFNASEGAL
jgi:PTH1 family peptidyl-tRNA hydrolase